MCAEQTNPHPHAESMKLYAEDATKSDKPWLNWQVMCVDDFWVDCCAHPGWDRYAKYRRKPKMITKWCIVWMHKDSKYIASSPYLYSSKEEALKMGAKLLDMGNYWTLAGVNSFTYEE